MKDVILYIAMSLDGYIADRSGGVGWLTGQDKDPTESGDGYDRFLKGVDTVVLGRKTYDQIVTELSPGQWVYEGLTSYVVTHRKEASAENIIFTGDDPCKLIRRLREEAGKAIWICGGADIIQPLIREGLINRFSISVIPTILGGGVRLFGELPEERRLRFLKSETANGITELTYELRE